MKKNYIAPEVVLMQVELQQMMAQSQFDLSADSQSIVISEEEVDKFTSRRSSVWDDDEDMY